MNEFEEFSPEFICGFLKDLDDQLKSRFNTSLLDENGGLRCATYVLNDVVTANNHAIRTGEFVDHPDHYNTGGLECIEAMRRLFGDNAVETFCKLTAFKYYFRRGNKTGEDFDRDTKKAEWYLNYISNAKFVKKLYGG